MFRAAILALLCLCFTASAEAATLHVSTSGSDSSQCTQSAPCKTFAKAYGAAAAGDTIQVATGTYPRQDVPAGTKAVTFKGGSGVKVRQLWNQASNLTYDGINVDANFARKETGLQLSGNRATFKNATVGNIADEKNIVNGDGHVIDNVTFHDTIMTPQGEAEGIHMECLYSQASNITIKNSRFTNCAVMDVFFTRGTWYNQPEYGGWTLTNNRFEVPRRVNGQGTHYYSVLWAWQSKYDRAVVRGNTYEAAVAAQDMNGANARFTNSVESCNTPAFNLTGMTKEACSGTPTEPAPTPTPEPEPDAPSSPTPDTQAPATPNGMAWGTITQTSIGVKWNATTDNVGVAGYRVYRDGTQVGTTTGTSYTVGGLACGKSYTIGLAAIDAAGNESNRAEATGTTSTAACTTAPAPAPDTSGLVGAWGFNETSGTTAADASGKGNAGAVAGATRTATGKFGRGLSFDGVDDVVTVPDSASLDLTKGMTLEAWINPTTVSDYRSVVFKENLAARRQSYSIYAANGNTRPTAEVSTGSALTTLPGSQTIAANTWTHIAATYDGANLRVYRNGVLIGTEALTGSLVQTGDPLKIGGNRVWTEWFKGQIDEVRVWSTARSAAQIQADMNAAI